jgi:hypothetical protein
MSLRIGQISAAMILYFVNEVRAVALIAGNAMSSVFGVFEKFLLFAGDVAGQTAAAFSAAEPRKAKTG